MKTAAFGVDSGHNGFVPIGTPPLNRSKQSRFGVLDVVIIAAMLLLTAGVLSLTLAFVLK